MAVLDINMTWSFMLMLAGAVGVSVNYSDPVCAVKGSTVFLRCTFAPLHSVIEDGREVLIEIVRVRWCQNHLLCHSSTPSVFDSDSPNTDPRYKYLGDKKGNCTLQITDVQKRDEATLRFRMEANKGTGHFTGTSGVKVTVIDASEMRVNSSSGDREPTAGEKVTLFCTALCTFHQLEVTWFKDGHALSESGPALQLGTLTAEDSGEYTCGLKSNGSTLSPPYRLHVEAAQEGPNCGTVDKLLVGRLVLFALHTVLIVVVASLIIRRMCFQESSRELKNVMVQPPESIKELGRPDERGQSV